MKLFSTITLFVFWGTATSYASPKLKVEVIQQGSLDYGTVMNKNGVIAIARVDGTKLWTPETGFKNLINITSNGILAGLQAWDINEMGQVTGIATTVEAGVGIQRAFIASEDKPLVLLENHVNVGSRHGVGRSINNFGTVQGSGNRGWDGVSYGLSGTFTTWSAPNHVPVSPSFGYGENFINDAGVCLSNYGSIFAPGATTFTRVQAPSNVTSVNTKVITNGGRIYGSTNTAAFQKFARVWSTDGTLLYTGTNIGNVLDATDAGDAVLGYLGSTTSIWNPIAGTVTPINSMLDDDALANGWQIGLATHISNQGHILASATDNNGVGHTVRLTPVPEPATIFALSAGMAGILARRRKRS